MIFSNKYIFINLFKRIYFSHDLFKQIYFNKSFKQIYFSYVFFKQLYFSKTSSYSSVSASSIIDLTAVKRDVFSEPVIRSELFFTACRSWHIEFFSDH